MGSLVKTFATIQTWKIQWIFSNKITTKQSFKYVFTSAYHVRCACVALKGSPWGKCPDKVRTGTSHRCVFEYGLLSRCPGQRQLRNRCTGRASPPYASSCGPSSYTLFRNLFRKWCTSAFFPPCDTARGRSNRSFWENLAKRTAEFYSFLHEV